MGAAEVKVMEPEMALSSDKPFILVLTSDEGTKAVLESTLSGYWDYIFVKSASAGISVIKGGLTPVLVIADAKPRRDELIKSIERLSKHLIHVPFMIVDELIPKDYEIMYLKLGIADFIYSPFSEDVVRQRICRTIKTYSDGRRFEEELISVTSTLKGERQRMSRLTFQLLSALASTIDAKDEYTRGHSNRVSLYSFAIAREAGCLDRKELETLVHAALLHDVGKIGISDAILRKPGKLSEDEFKVIKDHPAIGWNILKNVSMLPGISWVARWHHERYDGSGYPDGISGEAIPQMVRIVSIADSYDAMTSDRSYRKALSEDRAIMELKAGKGRQFDPYLADVAIDLISHGELLGSKLADIRGCVEEVI
jgi:putative two-component system response regulator